MRNRREFLDYPIEKGWKFRAYIEMIGKKEDFVISIEYDSEKDSIIRFDQSSHKFFHVDKLGNEKKPFKEFREATNLIQKIDCAFDFIRNDLNYIIEYKQYKLELNKNLLDAMKSKLINEIRQPELGKRTTSHSISSNVEFCNDSKKNVGK